MNGRALLVLALLLAPAILGAQVTGELCVAPEWACIATSGHEARVAAAEQPRSSIWRLSEPRVTIVDTIEPNQTVVRASVDGASLRFGVRGEKSRGWPLPVDVVLSSGKISWTWRVAAADLAKPQTVLAPPGVYELTLWAGRHRELRYPRVVVSERKIADLGTLELSPTTAISGQVFEAGKRTAVSGARISEPSGKRLATTDREGRFAFDSVDATLRDLVVVRDGFAERGVRIDRGGPDIELDPIVLDRGRSLRLVVDRNALSEPSDVTVELYRRIDGVVMRRKAVRLRSETLKPQQPGVRFENLAPGVYVAVIKGTRGLQQMARFLEVRDDRDSFESLRIDPRQVRIAVLHGDEPLANAEMLFDDEERLRLAGAIDPRLKTDPEGLVDEEIWLDGSPIIQVSHASLATPFFYRPRSESGIWTIEIPRQSVLVTVRDAATGAPIEGATVGHSYRSDDGEASSPRPARVEANGTLRLTSLRNGVHTLTAMAPGYSEGEPYEITIRDAKEERAVALTLTKQRGIRVTVLDANGIPQGDALGIDGFVSNGNNPARFIEPDRNGEFVLATTANERRTICVFPKGGSFLVTTLVADEHGGGEAKLVVPRAVGSLRLESSTVSGDVVQMRYILRYNGTFVPPAALRAKESHQRMISVDATTPVILDRMPAGKYEIWPYQTSLDLQRIQSNQVPPSATVQLVAGELDVRLTIEPKG